MDVGEVVEAGWGLTVRWVEPLSGGMNSLTWLVEAGPVDGAGRGTRFVVKVVGQADEAFIRGLLWASRLEAAGLTTGSPVPSRTGAVAEAVGDRQVALLRYVDGVPLTSAPENHTRIGTTLGRVHMILATGAGDSVRWFDVIGQFGAFLDLEPWIRPVVESAVDGVRELATAERLSWAGLHGDPAPEAFLAQRDGGLALIDWGSAMKGPVLYDLASAVMYLGRTETAVLDAYVAERPASAAELAAGLETFLRYRGAVQAAYFAWRCAADVGTGLSDAEGNRKGLLDARRMLDA